MIACDATDWRFRIGGLPAGCELVRLKNADPEVPGGAQDPEVP